MNKSLTLRQRQKEASFLVFLSFILFYLCLISVSSSCRLYKLEKKLDPENAEFLSKVRYIITKKERKIFLELHASERASFREEFWKRRDPDPSTEMNEFKMEYFNRIEQSNRLFLAEGKPGWLSDRGRIYILFGPSMDRITYPMGTGPYGYCQEIWYYGNFPVVFVDRTCTGNYYLVTYDLTSLRSLNLMYMHELSRVQAEAQKTIRGEKKFFDFNLKLNVKKTFIERDRVEGLIAIDIPYSSLWFKAEEEKLETILDLKLELKDLNGDLIWLYEDAYEVQIEEEELKKNKKKSYIIEIPFIIDKNVEKLRKGKNSLHVLLKNRTGQEKMRKVMEFVLH